MLSDHVRVIPKDAAYSVDVNVTFTFRAFSRRLTISQKKGKELDITNGTVRIFIKQGTITYNC